jgi:N-ethylmaleimide reductase
MNSTISLFESYKLNEKLTLKNRIVMAPMTRNVANDDLSPTKEMADYYARRADAGLIITEGTIIRTDARGYSNVPGIFTQEQINAWHQVTDKVHEKGGHIFLQIWHVGRVSHPHFLNDALPLSPSETTMTGRVSRSQGLNLGKSRAVTDDEIQGLVVSYAIAAQNAIAAGFDGIEIHGANGYLIDQFLHYHTNHRTDNYGVTTKNMARFALEVVKACGNAIGFNRVGLRLSPGAYLNEIVGDKRDAAVFQYLLEQLNSLSLAYVHTGNFDDKKKFEELNQKGMTEFMREHYHGTLIAAGGYTFNEAEQQIRDNQFDLIAIGRPFIANPDLIYRLQTNEAINSYNADMLTTLH